MIERQHDAARQPGAGTTGRSDAASDPDAIEAIMVGCERSLRETGIIGALRFLNVRTRFRYTGLYHVEPPILRNVQLFDRENPLLNVSGDVKPLHETYCGVVWNTNTMFRVTDALEDAHLAAHPARESVLSYCGVPVRSASGLPWGSLCHFDVRPRLLSVQESRILELVAPLFARWLSDRST
ncbi:hypothetical protein BH11GEM1_BH11GEM1_09630 [soil metagenome]